MSEDKSIKNMTFEAALNELEEIVRRLDNGQESLESAISSYERASELKKFCESKLKDAKFKIDTIAKNSEAQPE
jgi:exodeoxyribonuclease VII small subunit